MYAAGEEEGDRKQITSSGAVRGPWAPVCNRSRSVLRTRGGTWKVLFA